MPNMLVVPSFRILLAVAAFGAALVAVRAEQNLQPVLNAGASTLKFDWPAIKVGTGEYVEGPTGVTVIRFDPRALVAVDVRGGGPGTVNTDYVRLGYDLAELDAIVFAGGSWYGLEAITAVSSALKDDGVRDGNAFDANANIALALGGIIYDYAPRRLNEIYPDKPLAQAAFRAARPGVFPLGAQGAGRFAKTGAFFGCNAYSGQGGAFRQVGRVKVAAFTVVNAVGAVTKRDGTVAACYGDPSWTKPFQTKDLLANFAASRSEAWAGPQKKGNTTISVVVTNQRLYPAELNRLAIQVHTSMARALQPFATEFDGDVLYAVSTREVDVLRKDDYVPMADLATLASEVMWDAILTSVAEQPSAPPPNPNLKFSAQELDPLTGDYVFSEFVTVRISRSGSVLNARAVGKRDAYAIKRASTTALQPSAPGKFVVPGRYPLVLSFETPGKLVFNPGHWQQVGAKAEGARKR